MIRVFDDLETLSLAAAERFVEEARQVITRHGRFAVALAGGHTPRRTYQLLAEPRYRDAVAWNRVHVFWGDERYVPPTDPRSNARMARECLLDSVPIPPAQIHPVPDTGSAEIAARQYEKELREFFRSDAPRFDFVFLGLGDNAHTASLFPDTPALDEREAWATPVYVADQGLQRVTLTAPVLSQAALIVFLVSGEDKADALHEVLESPWEPHRLPAQLIQPGPKGEVVWLVDRAAAARLEKVS